MPHKLLQIAGITWTLAYGALIFWMYVAALRTLGQVAAEVRVATGAYEVDAAQFDEGLRLFRLEQFAAARDAFTRADPAQRDAQTQFYIAYAFYRQGWGRVYSDDGLFRQALDAVNRSISLAPDNTLVVNDAMLGARSAAELKTEIEHGLAKDMSDFNPLKVLRERK